MSTSGALNSKACWDTAAAEPLPPPTAAVRRVLWIHGSISNISSTSKSELLSAKLYPQLFPPSQFLSQNEQVEVCNFINAIRIVVARLFQSNSSERYNSSKPHIRTGSHKTGAAAMLLPYHVCITPSLKLLSSLLCGRHGTTAVAQHVCVGHYLLCVC